MKEEESLTRPVILYKAFFIMWQYDEVTLDIRRSEAFLAPIMST